MSPRLRGVWRSLAVAALVMAVAGPGLPQNRGVGRSRTAPARRLTPPLPARPGVTPSAPTLSRQAAARPAPPAPGAPAAAPPTGSPQSRLELTPDKKIVMEFYGLDIDHLLRLLSETAGVTIVKSDQVVGPVTVIAPEPVPLDVAFQILNSVLQVRGFAMVHDASGIYKVVPLAEAMQSGNIPVHFGANPEDMPDTSQLITQVIPLKNLNANDVANQIRTVLANYAVVQPTSTNSLIITDTAADISRALTIIANQESQLSGGLKPIHLQYYDASQMADLINTLILSRGGAAGGGAVPGQRPPYLQRLQPTAGPQPAIRPGAPTPAAPLTAGAEFVYPDTRTNTIIVQATPEHLTQIEDLVNSLDKPVSLRNSVVVYPVQNLVASDLANLLSAHLGIKANTVQAAGAAGPTGARPGTTTGPTGFGAGRAGTPFGGAMGGFGGYSGGINRGLGALSMEPSAAQPAQPASPAPAPSAPVVEVEPLAAPLKLAQADGGAAAPAVAVPAMPPAPEVEPAAGAPEEAGGYVASGSAVTEGITADNNTNTLVITAAPEKMELIKELIEKLDVVPPQVYIQAVIAEVDVTKDNSLGFQLNHVLSQITHTRGGGRPPLVYNGNFGDNFGLGGLDENGNPTLTGGLTGVITGPAGFTAIVNALGSDSHAKILSTPSIFTSNNQAGTITVASSVPVPQQSVTTATGTTTGVTPVVTQTVQYQPIGIILNVLPRVTQGDYVDMDVQVSADDIGQNVNVGGSSYPTFLTRQAQASGINLKDGYTVCLGGLMRDNVTHSKSKVPILGDIPLLGLLFRSSTDHAEKSELLVFLTPHIVRSPSEAAHLSDQEKSKMQELPRLLQKPSEPAAVPTPAIK